MTDQLDAMNPQDMKFFSRAFQSEFVLYGMDEKQRRRTHNPFFQFLRFVLLNRGILAITRYH